MSLARTALRLATVAALKDDPVIAAMCGEITAYGELSIRIYDSRLEEFDRKEPVPVIVVTTDDDRRESNAAGGPAIEHVVDLTVEIAMKALATDDADQVLGIGSPATDGEIEASLDLLEERVIEALEFADAASLVRKVTRRPPAMKSSRFVTDETGEKLAIRLVTLTASLKGEDRHAADIPQGPFARLPEPLRTVCAAMPEGSSARATCQMIHDALPPLEVELYTGADITLRPDPSQPLPQPGEGEPHAPLVQVQAVRP
ncbi:hypothetical protein [Microvirga arsenatis]|uniref:Uncharacterized protein n=1 Tax=Microvirga arsenatis TaxID=2692265 RepID=A0ABW9YXR8_9HYPH|nr:hypothetical protein [Microvirga arsenatis]NBJ13206.1 hypothetical protein [Microvirga arsenatis]NBJ25156.1 hypothetical protein [Microvirga arsenatis]